MSLAQLPMMALDAVKGRIENRVKNGFGNKAGGGLLDAVGMGQKPEAAASPAPVGAMSGVAANPIMQRKSPMLDDLNLTNPMGGY